ncbi:hypothetical protein F4703DRAFT_1855239, partial [Phycomyces blakesleeanus]
MSSTLPLEVLSIIADSLNTEEKLACSCVCKHWTKIFQIAAWSSIEIDSFVIQSIKEQSSGEKSIYQKNGKYVKKINLDEYVEVQTSEWQVLQREFPNIRYISVPHNVLEKFSFKGLSNWDAWTALQTAVFYLDQEGPTVSENFISDLSILPSLKRLEIIPIDNDGMELRIDVFEAIQERAPLLEYLKIKGNFVPFNFSDMAAMAFAPPADNVKEITLDCTHMDPHWLFYFGIKYPNVRKILVSTESSLIPRGLFCDITSLSAYKDHAFSHLEVMAVNSSEDIGDSPFCFWNMLARCNIPLKRLAYKLDSPKAASSRNSAKAVQLAIDIFSKTIKEMHISCFLGWEDTSFKPIRFGTCSNLVLLHIAGQFEIELDMLLDNCEALRNISFVDSKITEHLAGTSPEKLHNLTEISFNSVDLYDKTLSYISSRCRKLQTLCIYNSNITGMISPETGAFLIDMHHTHLKYLHWCGNDICSMNSYPNVVASIHTTAIQQRAHLPVLDEESDNNTKGEDKPSVYNDEEEEEEEEDIDITWIHDYIIVNGLRDTAHHRRVLDEDEIRIAKDYFRNFQARREAETPSGSDGVKEYFDSMLALFDKESSCHPDMMWNRRVIREDWKKDLYRGYAKLLLGSLDEYEVEESMVCDHRKYDYPTFLECEYTN